MDGYSSFSAHILDDIRTTLSTKNNGFNLIHLESSHVLPKLQEVFISEKPHNVNDSIVDTNKIMLSSNPVQVSIELANDTHLKKCSYANWDASTFSIYRTYDYVNS